MREHPTCGSRATTHVWPCIRTERQLGRRGHRVFWSASGATRLAACHFDAETALAVHASNPASTPTWSFPPHESKASAAAGRLSWIMVHSWHSSIYAFRPTGTRVGAHRRLSARQGDSSSGLLFTSVIGLATRVCRGGIHFLVSDAAFSLPSISPGLARTATDTLRRIGGLSNLAPSFPFRHFAREHLPWALEYGTQLRRRLETPPYFVVAHCQSLLDTELPTTKFFLALLAAVIGTPTATDVATESIAWEVRHRDDLPPHHRPTITERRGPAELHTDSSYRHQPERYVLMLCVRPAGDGGGASTVVAGREFVHHAAEFLANNGHDPTILRTTLFPFRVPATFTKSGTGRALELIHAPVVADRPLVRYRRDTMEEGLTCERAQLPVHSHVLAAARHAVDSTMKVTVMLRSGDLLAVNNHEVLHGRTSYHDASRLLIRVRAADHAA